VTWQPGRDRIEELLAAGELEQVAPSAAIARRLLEDAGRHLVTAARAAEIGDLAGAYQLAYDAFRKSAVSLIAVQGLRVTSRGGHLAVQEAAITQFGSTFRVFRALAIQANAGDRHAESAIGPADQPPCLTLRDHPSACAGRTLPPRYAQPTEGQGRSRTARRCIVLCALEGRLYRRIPPDSRLAMRSERRRGRVTREDQHDAGSRASSVMSAHGRYARPLLLPGTVSERGRPPGT
jgi:hypothetical protein